MRSLSFLDQQLSCGTGYGRVSFYDLRAAAWMDLDPESDAPPRCGAGARRPRGYQQLGHGWLCQTDSVYMCAPRPAPGAFAHATPTMLKATHCNQPVSVGSAWRTFAPSLLCKRSGVQSPGRRVCCRNMTWHYGCSGSAEVPKCPHASPDLLAPFI